jgi:hypothetical protein
LVIEAATLRHRFLQHQLSATAQFEPRRSRHELDDAVIEECIAPRPMLPSPSGRPVKTGDSPSSVCALHALITLESCQRMNSAGSCAQRAAGVPRENRSRQSRERTEAFFAETDRRVMCAKPGWSAGQPFTEEPL